LHSVDDVAEVGHNLQTISFDRAPALGDELLSLLLESASEIHGAGDEKSLADVLLDKACHGSGLPNAALLRPAGADGRIEVIAARATASTAPGFSRSLLNAAADGKVAELSADRQAFDASKSIVSLGVRSALCVPLMLGQTVAAFLYLDSRGDPNSAARLPLRPNASAFCVALARMAGLALSNLKRIDMERRGAHLEADLAAASEAQQWILPKPKDTLGRFSYVGRSQPGEYLGGDFFDVIPLDADRVAVAIGDVSGHGVAASVLMTATAGFLHAALEQTGDVAEAVNRLNQFIAPRRAFDRFVTLWVGVLDLRMQSMRFVDAGHSYAFQRDSAGHFPLIKACEHVPVGVDEHYVYTAETRKLEPSGDLLLISDGMIEQFGPPGDPSHEEAFGIERLERAIREATETKRDAVTAIFEAVAQYSGNPRLSDDATGLLINWS
jgi:serine phosphatase RsbU (regulator of sigma subunit)